MDNISINKASSLYWLGRYTERAYTLIYYVRGFYDRMVDMDVNAYSEFCDHLGIPDKYEDKNDFVKRFISDKDGEVSIAYALNQAYDNAIILRDKLGSRTLCYIQLACNELTKSFNENCKIIDLQRVTDYLIAFWGAVDDYITEEDIRNLIKAGKYAERIDLYNRFGAENSVLEGAAKRLSFYARQLEMDSSSSKLLNLVDNNLQSDHNIVDSYINKSFRLGEEQ